MNKYRCHKEVEAMKIEEIELHGPEDGERDHVLLGRENNVTVAVEVSTDYIARHSPEVGGYYVKYKDGYESFSPAAAFEGGYTEITE